MNIMMLLKTTKRNICLETEKDKSVGLGLAALNVEIITGKSKELADMIQIRKADIFCVQEPKWEGCKARSIVAGFELFHQGVKRNRVGVVLKEEFEVKRMSDRIMCQLEVGLMPSLVLLHRLDVR